MTEDQKEMQSRITNLTAMGVSLDLIKGLINQGLSMDKVEDYCNRDLNNKSERCMKAILKVLAEKMSKFSFFPLNDEEVKARSEAKDEISKEIAIILLEENIMYSKIDLVLGTLETEIAGMFTNTKDNLGKVRSDVFAKLLGRELLSDITMKDIHDKSMELNKEVATEAKENIKESEEKPKEE